MTATITSPAAARASVAGHASTTSFEYLSKAFVEVSKQVKTLGLLKRAGWFYLLMGLALALGLAGAATGASICMSRGSGICCKRPECGGAGWNWE